MFKNHIFSPPRSTLKCSTEKRGAPFTNRIYVSNQQLTKRKRLLDLREAPPLTVKSICIVTTKCIFLGRLIITTNNDYLAKQQ